MGIVSDNVVSGPGAPRLVRSGGDSVEKPKSLGLSANCSWNLVAAVFTGAARWSALIILAKFANPEVVGMYVLGVVIVGPVLALTNCAITSNLLTDRSVVCPYGRYVAFRIFTAIVNILVVACVAICLYGFSATSLVIILVGVSFSVQVIREILFAVMQRHERMNLSGRSQIVESVLSLSGFAITFILTRSLLASLAVLIVIRIGVMLLHDVPWADRVVKDAGPSSLKPEWSLKPLLMVALPSLPLTVYFSLNVITLNMPRYVIDACHGKAALGIFACLSSVMTGFALIANSIGTATIPRLSRHFMDDRPELHRLLRRLLLLVAVIGAAAVITTCWVGREILTILFTAEYARYASTFVMVTIALGLFMIANILQHVVIALRGFVSLLIAGIVILPVAVLASKILIGSDGIRGAAMAMIVLMVVWVFVLAFVLWWKLKSNPPELVPTGDRSSVSG